MIMSKKERLVAAIESGTVIDHIPAEKTFQVVNLLQLQKTLHTCHYWFQLLIEDGRHKGDHQGER